MSLEIQVQLAGTRALALPFKGDAAVHARGGLEGERQAGRRATGHRDVG